MNAIGSIVVPHEIIDAAHRISTWFKENGISDWKLDGCASREWLERLQSDAQDFDREWHNR